MTKQNSYSYAELLRSGEGTLFGHESARLPTPNMLMTTRIVNMTTEGGKYDKGQILAELDIDPDMWFFKCHFPGDPVMPGCLGLDALWQLTGFFLAWLGYKGKGRALGVDEVKFSGQILPTSKLVTFHIDVKRIIARKLVM
ncbi:MAG: bifunctional 3-hydroxydecanoyl-ACP dehydratase/trans-2-decenoyl-ACP isomerase, partial [Candidatus Neomarinimicrobiota bacterium]